MSNEPKLIQNVRWGENYVSQGLNRKLYGLVAPGIYKGFEVKPAGKMQVFIDHSNGENNSVAVVERDGYSLTVIMEDSGYVEIPAIGEWYICIEAYYSPKQVGYERIVARESIDPHHIILAKVTVADNNTEIVNQNISYTARTKCERIGYNAKEIINKVQEIVNIAQERGQLGDPKYLGNPDLNTVIESGNYFLDEYSVASAMANNVPMGLYTHSRLVVNNDKNANIIQQILISEICLWIRIYKNGLWGGWNPQYIKTGNISIYLSKNGSDNNTGLSPDYPVLTVSRAITIANGHYQNQSTSQVSFLFGAGDWGDISFLNLPYYLYILPYDVVIHNEYSDDLPKFGILNFEGCNANLASIIANRVRASYGSALYISKGYKSINNLLSDFSGAIMCNDGTYELGQQDFGSSIYVERGGELVFGGAVNFKLKENITTTEFVGVGRDGTILLPSTCTFTLNGHTFTGNKLGTQSGAKIITSFTPEGFTNDVPSSVNNWFGNGLNANNGIIFNGIANGNVKKAGDTMTGGLLFNLTSDVRRVLNLTLAKLNYQTTTINEIWPLEVESADKKFLGTIKCSRGKDNYTIGFTLFNYAYGNDGLFVNLVRYDNGTSYFSFPTPNNSATNDVGVTAKWVNQKLGSTASLTALSTLDETDESYIETIEIKKQKAIAELNSEAQQAIYSGFPYEIEGQEYFIGYSLYDQANLNGDAVVAMQNPGKVMSFRCTDDMGNPVWLDIPTETILDIQKYGIVSHRDMIRRDADGKKARIMAAASEEEIKAIIME